jgi:CDP-glucose 4,6-dehydratase
MEGLGMSEWAGRRVLVTGATGIVGSWLVKELLAQNAYVVALVLDADPQSELVRSGDLQKCAVVTGALEDISSIERAATLHEVDSVFHLGAQTIVGVARRAPLATLESNVRGTYNVLEVCRRHADLIDRIVVASSDKAYGEAERLPYTEDSPLAASHPYDVSKAAGDMIAQAYHHTYGLPVAIARCGNIYGGGDLNWSRIVPGTIRSLLADERPVLRSDGTFVRDYLYVRDAVQGYLDLGARLEVDGIGGGGFNFSAEDPVTVADLVSSISELMGKETIEPIIHGDAVGEIHDQSLSAAKARRLLGWKPSYDRRAGMMETIGWYREFFDR